MNIFPTSDLFSEILPAAFRKREALAADPNNDAYRLFNGFYEGCPLFTIDRYAGTAVIQWMNKKIQPGLSAIGKLCDFCTENIPGNRRVLYKNRYSGQNVGSGDPAEETIREWGVSYKVDLQVNKDCGFYLDSALLRKWLLENSAGKRILNTFAYTGSLGNAAEAGGALSVTQTDINRNYLSSVHSTQEYIIGDFFRVAASLRRSGRLFDTIILDPPFFANAGRNAKVDQARSAAALINKVRPMAAHQGKIIAVNNALFLSGSDYLKQLESLCGDCLAVSGIIPVPESFFGFEPISSDSLPADPAPFNHPTKIVILDVFRKDGRQ